jgi:hypothetical protein
VRLSICIVAILSPVLGYAQFAGDWAGVAVDAQGAHRIVLHISGPFTAMKASADIPDQKLKHAVVESITFSDSTLEFSIPGSDARYSGLLNDGGAIVGTLTQHGVGAPLVLSRVAAAGDGEAHVPPEEALGSLQNGRYHNNASGVEFNLPAGWSLMRYDLAPGDPGQVAVFSDPSGKAILFTAYTYKVNTAPENIPKLLAGRIAHQLGMRAGTTGQGPSHMIPNYSIREGSVEHTSIGGHEAVRAVGEYQRGDQKFGELLAWIDTENTRTYFMVRAPAENLQELQGPVDEMLQTARIP